MYSNVYSISQYFYYMIRKSFYSRLFLQFYIQLFVLSQTFAFPGHLSVNGNSHKAVLGYSFRNISGTTMKDCLEHCLTECRCLSFQICGDECQLCSTNPYNITATLPHHNECTLYNFGNRNDVQHGWPQCGPGHCHSVIDCCLTSQPCLNGGTCVATYNSSGYTRFTCKCASGYTGDRCETIKCKPGYKGENCETSIQSCRGHNDGTRVPGIYTIVWNDTSLQVYCDFGKSAAWTLVQSYYLELKILQPLQYNLPINEAQAPSWEQYRLSKGKMNAIKRKAKKWRITCNYDKDGTVQYQDYVHSTFQKLNIMNFVDSPGRCVQVDYINVRGRACRNCSVYMAQAMNYDGLSVPLSFLSSSASICGFVPPSPQYCEGNANEITRHENNFGLYECVNANHRCSSSNVASTQLWFGA